MSPRSTRCWPVVATMSPAVTALETVEADDVEPLILGIGQDGARRRRALAGKLDHVAFRKAQCVHDRARQPGEPAPAVVGPHVGDLQPPGFPFLVRHAVNLLMPRDT